MAIQNINAGDEWGVIRSALNSNFTLLDSKSIGTGIVIDADKFFADEAARDAYFTSQPNNGQIIAVLKEGNNYDVQQYYNSTWNNIAFGVKVDNTIFPTISAWAVNENGELEYQGIVRVKELITDPGTVRIGDSSLKSGFRIISTKSSSTGNSGVFEIQLFDENGFKKATVFKNEGTQINEIQNLSSVTSPSDSISFKEICQNSEMRIKKRIKPSSGTITENFNYVVKPSADSEPIFNRLITPSECTNVGDGVFEFALENPTGVDVGSELFIDISGITLLGGTFDGTDGIRFGDANNNNFFPFIEATSIALVREDVATEKWTNEKFSNPTWVAEHSTNDSILYGGFKSTGRIRERDTSTGEDKFFQSNETIPISSTETWNDWINRESIQFN